MQIVIPCFALAWIILLPVAIWAVRRSLRPAPNAFAGEESFHTASSDDVTLGSYRIHYDYAPPKRTKNGIIKRRIKMSLQKISPVAIYLYAQTPMDEWLFKYGFAHELVMGIPWLDRQFNISTSDEPAARKFLAREDVQNLLRQLISPSFVSFSIEPKGYSIVLEDFDPRSYENLHQMVLSMGQRLCDFFPAVHENFLKSSMEKAAKLARVHGFVEHPALTAFLFIALLCLYIGLVIFYRIYEPVHALDTFLFFAASSAGIFLALLFLCRPFFRNVSLPGRGIKSVATLFLISVWTMFLAALLVANVKMDHSPAQKVSERVLTKWVSQSGRSHTRHYLIRYEAPSPAHVAIDRETVESELSYQEWQNVHPGDDFIHLEIRPGYFGAPWIQAHWFGQKNNWSD